MNLTKTKFLTDHGWTAFVFTLIGVAAALMASNCVQLDIVALLVVLGRFGPDLIAL